MTDRTSLRRHVAVAAVVGLLSALPACTPASTETAPAPEPTPPPAADQRPNVLLVLADDLGWSDVSSELTTRGNGHDFIETPTFDRLAEEGAAFDNAYAAATCSPSRMALMTGTYAPRPDNNVFMVGDIDRGGPGRMLTGPRQGRPDGRLVLPQDATTMAQVVRDAGYATGYAGKFHVTRFPAQIENFHGFEENAGGSQAGAIGDYHARRQEFDYTVAPSLDRFAANYTQAYVDSALKPYSIGVDQAAVDDLVGSPKHVTDALGDATLDFVDRHADQPFLAVLGEYGVHTPVGPRQARRDLLAKYEAKEPGESRSDPPYAAIAEGVDQSLGRIIDHLEQTPDPRNPGQPLADNTVVVVTSDNGGRTDVGGDNGPLRGQKGELDEGGVRVPWVVWSGNEDLVRPGVVNSSPISLLDLFPTLAEYAGLDPRPGLRLDGESLAGTLATGEPVDRPLFSLMPGYLLARGRDQRPEAYVRAGRWKLRYSFDDRRFRLYDLEADPGESTDLADEQAWRVAGLGETLLYWMLEVDAPLATLAERRRPVSFTVQGRTYADGRIRVLPQPTTITVQPGEEMPYVLPDR